MASDYKFDLMYSKRAFVHWYVGEGMEEVCRLFRITKCKIDVRRFRGNFRRPVKTLQRSKKTMKKSVLIPLMLKRTQSTRLGYLFNLTWNG